MYNREIEEIQVSVQNHFYRHDQFARREIPSSLLFDYSMPFDPYHEKFMSKTNPFFFD